jgi:hypothetical protein
MPTRSIRTLVAELSLSGSQQRKVAMVMRETPPMMQNSLGADAVLRVDGVEIAELRA